MHLQRMHQPEDSPKSRPRCPKASVRTGGPPVRVGHSAKPGNFGLLPLLLEREHRNHPLAVPGLVQVRPVCWAGGDDSDDGVRAWTLLEEMGQMVCRRVDVVRPWVSVACHKFGMLPRPTFGCADVHLWLVLNITRICANRNFNRLDHRQQSERPTCQWRRDDVPLGCRRPA